MKRMLYDFASGSLIQVNDDAKEEDIYAYMKANKYRVMYICFNNYEGKN